MPNRIVLIPFSATTSRFVPSRFMPLPTSLRWYNPHVAGLSHPLILCVLAIYAVYVFWEWWCDKQDQMQDRNGFDVVMRPRGVDSSRSGVSRCGGHSEMDLEPNAEK